MHEKLVPKPYARVVILVGPPPPHFVAVSLSLPCQCAHLRAYLAQSVKVAAPKTEWQIAAERESLLLLDRQFESIVEVAIACHVCFVMPIALDIFVVCVLTPSVMFVCALSGLFLQLDCTQSYDSAVDNKSIAGDVGLGFE